MSDAIPKKLSRGWCFTLNNYSESEYDALLGTECVYVCIGKEVGASGTPHLQGYLYYRTEKSFTQVRSLCSKCHWEAANGSPADNRVYCSKDGKFEERGKIPMSSKRKGEVGGAAEVERWESARKSARVGNLDEIPADLYLRFYRTLKEIKKDHMVAVSDAEDCTGVWLYGPSGSGKSRCARIDYPGAYKKMPNKWWDGYQGQDSVIIDDLMPKHEKLDYHLKIWADRYAFLAETKGGACCIRPKNIVITSQYTIDQIFAADPETVAALKRRFVVKQFVVMEDKE